MRHVWNVLLKGLAAILPVGLTVYLIYWLIVVVERTLRSAIVVVVPEPYYVPGMGLIAGVVLLYLIGLAVNAWVVRRALRMGERFLERIPLIKSIYGTLRDFTEYVAKARKRRELQQVVMVKLGETHLMGFLTGENIRDIPGVSFPDDIVAVYLPMSYQIGGYTLYLPSSLVEKVDLSIEDAMRRVLTAGLSKTNNKPTP